MTPPDLFGGGPDLQHLTVGSSAPVADAPVSGMCGCAGGLLSGGPNTCHCFCRDLTSAATVVADEFGHPADSPDRLAWSTGLPGPTPALTARSRSPSTRAFTDRRRDGQASVTPGDLTLRGAHNRLCAHSQLRVVVSAE